MPGSGFYNVAKQLYLNRSSAWVFFCEFAKYFQNTFCRAASVSSQLDFPNWRYIVLKSINIAELQFC